MADSYSIQIRGMEDLQRKLAELEPKLSKRILRSALSEVGKDLQAQAIEKAPVKTGALVAAFTSKVSVGKNKVSVKVGADAGNFDGQFSLAFFELGTRHQPARPFLRPLINDNDANIIENVGEKIKDGLENI